MNSRSSKSGTYFPRPPRRPKNMPLPNRKHDELRLRWRLCVAEELGRPFPKNEREWRFCALFVAIAVRRMRESGRISKRLVRGAAVDAVREAGYREKSEHAVARRAEEQFALPRTQAGILEIFRAAGVDVASVAGVFSEILDAPLERTVTTTETDARRETVTSGVSATDKLKAADLFFKVTTGFAPAKTANLNSNVQVDASFAPEEFKTTPPIKTAKRPHDL